MTALGTAAAGKDFTEAFAAKAGYAAQLTLNTVTPEQCAFVSALRNMSGKAANPVSFSVKNAEIRGNNADTGAVGDPLNLSLSGTGGRNAYLFVMDHNGGIQNINRLCPSCFAMNPDGFAAALSLFSPAHTEVASAQSFHPVLVFAVASPKPLISINAQDAFDANDFIAPFLKEISGSRDVSTAVAFVKLKDQ